jgi:DNA-binding NtrC family response regulator
VKAKVLIIDDEEAIRSSLQMIFEYEGYECILAANGPAALKIAEKESPDLVFLDIKMPQMDGMEVLKKLKGGDGSPPVVILSGHGNIKTAVEATKLGAFDFIEKPPESDRILLVARNALSQKKLSDENRRLKLSFDERYRMVGKSSAIEKVWDSIKRAAPTNATVLITGESGVGKELVARAIHRNSLRKDEAFVQVNCAAIPEDLIESELFGHEKGSFTGATEKQIGKFELAHRGTIFLDEVGDMSLRTQAKVLRVLQEGEFERVGGQQSSRCDVRVVAATNKDLPAEVAAGRFREDLYYRLAVVPVHVPPLRERKEDVPELAEAFLAEACARNGRRSMSFERGAFPALQGYEWPGNVRELKNLVERLAILCDGPGISADDVAAVLPGARRPRPERFREGVPLKDLVDEAERDIVLAALEQHHDNVAETARALGLERSHLYKKMRALGVRRGEPE